MEFYVVCVVALIFISRTNICSKYRRRRLLSYYFTLAAAGEKNSFFSKTAVFCQWCVVVIVFVVVVIVDPDEIKLVTLLQRPAEDNNNFNVNTIHVGDASS